MKKLTAVRAWYTCVLLAAFFGAGCPTGPPARLLATLALDHAPSCTSFSMAVDSDRHRAYVADGQRIRTIDLETLAFVEPGSAQGVFYGIDDEDDLVAAISPENGQVRQILPYSTPLGVGFATGMAYNPNNSTSFVLDIASPGGAVIIYEMDMRDGTLTQIGQPGLGIDLMRALCLARNPQDGSLYTVTPEDYLFRIDPVSGTATQIGYVGSDFDNIQDLAFSPEGALYGIHSGNPSVLVALNTNTGAGARAAELPLSYAFGSLAFKPDGTLWAVDLTRDALVQINLQDGSILTEFTSLVLNLPFKQDPAFEGIDSLTYFPSEPVSGRIYETYPLNGIESVALFGEEGGILVSTTNFIEGLDNTLGLTSAPVKLPAPLFSLPPHLQHLVYNSASGLAYGRDELKGKVYEIDPVSLSFRREIQYVEPSSETMLTTSNPIGVDPATSRLFVEHDKGALYVVDLAAATAEKVDYEPPVEGVVVDAARRRLYVATQDAGAGAFLDKLDLDTLERLDRTAVDHEISMMAFDATRNRMAVNARLGITTRSGVFLYDLETLRKIPFSLSFDSWDPRITVDSVTNRLIVAPIDDDPRVLVYALPD
jgi:DNA-binding beta-propeller fold protein YncE